MSTGTQDALALWSSTVPVLPAPATMQWALQLAWGLVLACLGVVLAKRWTRQRGLAVLAALVWAGSAFLPGSAASSYWLGLAFQAPSTSAVVLGLAWLVAQWRRDGAESVAPPLAGAPLAGVQAQGIAPDTVLAGMGVVLGWALLLDAFALLPVSLYAWGFSPAAPVLVVLAGLLPWALWGAGREVGQGALACLVAVLVFVLLRLPRGNLWDAVLDPWLWLVLHVVVVRRIGECYKNRSCLRRMGGR